MPTESPRPARKRAGQYHHGDLRRALLQAAVRTIDRKGVEALTLRAVGESVGVSRTALYRHFRDKDSLLADVASEGFRTLRDHLAGAWNEGKGGRAGFLAMGRAYVLFAVAHPAYYRVMFGGFRPDEDCAPELAEAGSHAFQVLVDALTAQQGAGLVISGDVRQQALFVWATVHGIAMLAIDRQLGDFGATGDELVDFAVDRLAAGLAA